MPTLTKELRKNLGDATKDARLAAEAACRAALENLAVHEKDYRGHMTVDQRQLRNRLRARGRALGDPRDPRTGLQEIRRLTEDAAYEHWHRLLFTRYLTENHLLHTDEEQGGVPVTLQDCEELAPELGARDGFDLACRFASRTLPGVFRGDDPIFELNIPQEWQVRLREILDTLPSDVFTATDSLGWTYQFWQEQRKKDVNEAGNKIGADELSAVTQLFTEDYMVDFLLDNTLGAWWAAKRMKDEGRMMKFATEEEARQFVALPGCPWKYLRFISDATEANPENRQLKTENFRPAAGTFDGWPKHARELRCLDPCMGSGHFVVALFDRLVALRLAEEKLDEAAAVAAVIRDNLFGLEIDPRCTQIGAFNLALAAWRRVGHCKLPAMNLACSGLAPNTREADWLAIAGDNQKLQRGMERLYRLFQKAAVLGSLINPRAGEGDLLVAAFHELQPLLEKALAQETKDDTAHEMAVTARGLAKAAEILAGQFTLVATNVPYLGSKKQDDVLKDYCERTHPHGKADLATCFVERCLDFCATNGTVSLVTPQNWLFLGTYEELRQAILSSHSWCFVARLGPKGFQTPMWDFNIGLLVITRQVPSAVQSFAGLDVAGRQTPSEKARGLFEDEPTTSNQLKQVNNPDSRITFQAGEGLLLLSQFATDHQGLSTGDNHRFRRVFWEVPTLGSLWEAEQSSVEQHIHYSGRSGIVMWSTLAEFSTFCRPHRGNEAWGRLGVAVAQIGKLCATLFGGQKFDTNAAVLVPRDGSVLPALWAFCSSPEFHTEVRHVDQKLNVTNATLVKIPFDLTHWQKVAAEKYPHGLPKPFSSDPTQWLFNGHPAGADQTLHVAVARLLGYQWPRQTGSSFPDCPALGPDGLEELADDDGIVCLPALNREQPAAARLRALLAEALGSFDEKSLLAGAGKKGSKSKTLEDWLRDEFFEQHCDLFHQRPFVWHVWDGRKDGFAALVNYHKLDHATLQKLTYTYLGNWIHDQEADAKADKPGAAERLGAARKLQEELARILEGEAPYDLFIRWKPLHRQPVGWHPDPNDGVRLNIRPFLAARDVGKKDAGILRARPSSIKWTKDRGKEPLREKADSPWFWCETEPGTNPEGGKAFTGNRWNDVHLTLDFKKAAHGVSG